MNITDEMLFEHAAAARDIWLSTLPADEDIPEIKCSRAFERKMQKLLNEQRRTPKTNKILRGVKQTIAAVLAIAMVSFGGLMTVEAYREKVIEFVVQIFNELTDYHFVSEKTDADQIELPEISFEYVPESAKETENRFTANNRRYVLYEDDAGQFFELTQRPIGADGKYGTILDTEDAEFEHTSINGNEGFYNEKGEDAVVVWTNNNIVYRLYGNIDISELKRIAESIKIIEK